MKPKPRPWDSSTFFPSLEHKFGADVTGVARALHDWACDRCGVEWPPGATYGGFVPHVEVAQKKMKLFKADIDGQIQWYSGTATYFLNEPPFCAPQKTAEFANRLKALGISIPLSQFKGKGPRTALRALAPEAVLGGFLETLDWVVESITGSRKPDP